MNCGASRRRIRLSSIVKRTRHIAIAASATALLLLSACQVRLIGTAPTSVTSANIVAGVPSALYSTISGTSSILANGIATSTITITLKDGFNSAVAGSTPTFTATNTGGGNTYGACSASDASGVSTCTLASTKAETKTLALVSPAVTGGTVTFVAGAVAAATSTITGTGSVVADGSATSTVTVTLLDVNSNPVAGTTPTFTATNTGATNTYGACSASDASGVSTCTLASTKAEVKTLSIATPVAKADGTVTFVAGAAVAANSTITGTGSVTANGSSTSTVTITLIDINNNLVSGITPTFSATDTGTTNTYGACSASNASGVSTCTLASTKAEVKTLSIATPVAKADGTVTFVAGAVSATTSTIAGTGPVSADGVATSTITITLLDANSNPIAGTTPTFTATDTGTSNSMGACSATNASGVSTCTLASAVHETKTIAISSPAGLTTVTNTVSFTAYCPATLTPAIAAVYPTNGANWNDYVTVTNAIDGVTNTAYNQPDTACAGTETGYQACIHGGEKKMATLTGQKSCTFISASDTLGVFDWECKMVSGVATVYSKGIKIDKGVADLINGTYDGFASNRLTVSKSGCGSPYLQTPSATTWWGNAVENLNTSTPGNTTYGATVTLTNASKLYVIAPGAAIGNGVSFRFDADKVGLITLSGAELRHSGAAVNIVAQSGSRKFAWLEGTLNGNSTANRCAHFSDLKHSRFHRIRCQTTINAGIYLINGTVQSNLFTDVYFSNYLAGAANPALMLAEVRNNTFHRIRIDRTTSNIPITLYAGAGATATGNSFVDLSIHSPGDRAIHIGPAGTTGTVSNTVVVGAVITGERFNIDGLAGLATGTTLSHATIANQVGKGINTFNSGTNVSGTTINNVAIANHSPASGSAIALSGTNFKIYDIAAAHGRTGIAITDVATLTARGILDLGNHSIAHCTLSGTNSALELDASCNYGSALGQTATLTTSLASSFVGKVSSDTTNTSDSSGTQSYASIANAQWSQFDNFYRGWGKEDVNAFPDTAHTGSCATGQTCRIWDWRLSSSDTALRGRHGTFTSGAACPASVSGATAANVITDGASRVFLKNAVEVMLDGEGNDNGLCESNESCIFAPNIGAYQGEGALSTSTCTYTGGNGVTGVRMYGYSTNGG